MTAPDHDEQLAELLADLSDRMAAGEQIQVNDVAVEYPQFADELRELWGAMMLADAVGSHLSDQTSDLEDSDSFGASLQLPMRMGDFELVEELGRGGMGVVYRARQVSLNRDVAVKMILRGQLASDAERSRFRSEAEAAASIDHPSIVPVYEVGEFEERPFFVMKYIPGETLADRLVRGPLEMREAANLVRCVARAIDMAHRRGVLHRDLKPSNILIDKQGEPHVTDFGLAKQIEDGENLTHTGAILGTPSYMSPEQAAGSRGEIGPLADVYSLGAILYATVTGQPPFRAASPVDTVLLVLEQDPVPPRVINPLTDDDLQMICLRCLQKPSDLRYSSAGDLADDLEAFLANEPITARSGRLSQVVSRLFRETHHAVVLENWGLLWMWHSLVLFIICALTNALYWWDQAQGTQSRWPYFLLWTAFAGVWAAIFWALRRRMGPVTFVERQIAHIWAASMIAIGLLFPLEYLLGLEVLKLSPVVGLVTGMVFFVKAGILSGSFYLQAFALFLVAIPMALFPSYAHLIFGTVSAGCFFFPGLKYYRQRQSG